MRLALAPTRSSVSRAAAAAAGSRQFVRGLKFAGSDYKASVGFSKFSEELEDAVKAKLDSLPQPGRVFQNADGTARTPSEEELKTIGQVGQLSLDRASFLDRIKLSSEQRTKMDMNTYLLHNYVTYGRRILDKIPTEDPTTGEITWTVVREKQKEGWEDLAYYVYVPGLLILLYLVLFLDKENLGDWAMEELRLRAQERFNDTLDEMAAKENVSDEELRRRDALIVERIISGEYDRLAGLRKAGSDMPASLV